MIRLLAIANYDFIKWRRWAFSVTGGIMLVGLAFLVTRGLNYSIEFTGGTLIQVESAKRVETGLIRRSLDDVGLHGADIQTFGSDTSFVIRSRIGHEAATDEVATPAVVLTVVGYSLNDTIIIFDRVRENLRKYRRQNLYEILNLSINETLPRSVLTHGTTIATTLALLILAGEVIRPFAWVMSFGIFTGTFSSIYIAAPVLLFIEKRWPGQDARGARTFGARAPAGASTPEATRQAPATTSPHCAR